MFPGRKGEVAEKVMRAIKENEVYIFTDPREAHSKSVFREY
jgi:hypothetical protein